MESCIFSVFVFMWFSGRPSSSLTGCFLQCAFVAVISKRFSFLLSSTYFKMLQNVCKLFMCTRKPITEHQVSCERSALLQRTGGRGGLQCWHSSCCANRTAASHLVRKLGRPRDISSYGTWSILSDVLEKFGIKNLTFLSGMSSSSCHRWASSIRACIVEASN